MDGLRVYSAAFGAFEQNLASQLLHLHLSLESSSESSFNKLGLASGNVSL